MTAKIIDDKTIEIYDLTQFNIDAIMHSGQVFRYFPITNGYQLIAGNNYAEITAVSDKTIIKCNNADYWFNYFDLQTDYNELKKELLTFKSLVPAITVGGGIRILRAEFHEMVISFIISANNNIKRFTKTLNLLSEQYGNRLPNGLHAFPTLEQLTNVTPEDFRRIGCGYRSDYLPKAVRQLKDIYKKIISESSTSKETNPFLQTFPSEIQLRKMDAKTFVSTLISLSGVGRKVASCVGLFSDILSNAQRFTVCPVDVHIKRAFEQLGIEETDAILNHKYAGVAQQYIFYYVQHLKGEL